MKYYLGISLGYNASACIFSNSGELLYAASEERFTGEKNCKKFPFNTIKNGLKELGITGDEITYCAYSHYQTYYPYDILRHTFNIDDSISDRPKRNIAIDTFGEKALISIFLGTMNIRCPIERINHHLSHAMSSFYFYPVNKDMTNYYIVADGFGDGDSISIFCDYKGWNKIMSLPMCKSLGLLYQFTTGALGYAEHKHEGKITGLAAFGKPVYYDAYDKLFTSFETLENDKEIDCKSPIIDFSIFQQMKLLTYGFVQDILLDSKDHFETSKDIAASLQNYVEDKIIEFIKPYLSKECNVYLSGGLFANVKINQRIHEKIDTVKNIYVAPPMGDEGTCVGSVVYKLYPNVIKDCTNTSVRKGTFDCRSYEDVLSILREYPRFIVTEKFNTISECTKNIALDLTQKKIICVFDGRMEFGPRALIGRSIIYNCKDKSSNDWLNKQLGRTEFMPFAPFCKSEYCDDLFYNCEGKKNSMRHMTVTVDCKDEFVNNYPAACHIDNTARPQIVFKDEYPLAWKILDEYEKMTGEKVLINTSFNLHNYPIIENIETAISSWFNSNTDSLYITCSDGYVCISRLK